MNTQALSLNTPSSNTIVFVFPSALQHYCCRAEIFKGLVFIGIPSSLASIEAQKCYRKTIKIECN